MAAPSRMGPPRHLDAGVLWAGWITAAAEQPGILTMYGWRSGIIGMQTDDTLILADDTFATGEMRKSHVLSSCTSHVLGSHPRIH
jgi:hypothetical protein